ncbi:MAG: hypothetical protein H7Y86_17540 [Rhizobacter sp.]|nr:hypothetical protein [Ferruginibacter sp.]
MKLFSLIILGFLLHAPGIAQRLSKQDISLIQKKEDSLKGLSFKIIKGVNPVDRLNADSIFTRVFVRALKTKNSFYYPFDSIYTVSKLYAPDSSFRIYTWQMVINENVIRQHGAIQMKTADGSLKLFPLIDKSDITTNMADTIANNFGWMGAVYYRIIETKAQGKSFFTLLGYDENNIRSNKKVIEVLTFNNDQPVFGARQFSIASGFGYKNNMARFIMEFKKDASPRLTYDNELNMIVFEHLVSESNQPNKKWTMIGDGDYEGFKWMDGRWVYVNKIFSEVTPEGKAPTPLPLDDSKLNTQPPPPSKP